MKEADIMRACQIAASECGARVFRNNVGKAWVGRLIEVGGNRVILSNPRYFHAGLGKGSADLVGWTKEGKFLAIEVKAKRGRSTKEQDSFIREVNRAGGVGFIARCPEDVKEQLG